MCLFLLHTHRDQDVADLVFPSPHLIFDVLLARRFPGIRKCSIQLRLINDGHVTKEYPSFDSTCLRCSLRPKAPPQPRSRTLQSCSNMKHRGVRWRLPLNPVRISPRSLLLETRSSLVMFLFIRIRLARNLTGSVSILTIGQGPSILLNPHSLCSSRISARTTWT